MKHLPHHFHKHGFINLYPTCSQPDMSPSWKRVADCRSCSNDTLLGCGIAISTGKVEAGKWKGMVFIPRAQPLCRPVSLSMTLRGETEGILSFLPSIPVKSFIIQLPDYLKNLTRLWFLTVFVCLTVWKGERGALPVVRCTPWLSPTPLLPSRYPIPFPPSLLHQHPSTPLHTILLHPTKLVGWGDHQPSSCALSFSYSLLNMVTELTFRI